MQELTTSTASQGEPPSSRARLRSYRRLHAPNPFLTTDDWSSGKRYLLTVAFGGMRFRQAAMRLTRQAQETGWFDRVLTITDDSPEPWVQEFMLGTAEFRKRFPAAFGLWCWKPFSVLKTLSQIEEGAHLYYIDAGCELSRFGEGRMKTIDRDVAIHGCAFFSTPFIESQWTKSTLLERFESSAGNTPQIQAVWFGVANSPRMRDLITRWWRTCSDDDFWALKAPSPGTDETGPAQHRYDQSVLSCIVKSSMPPIPVRPWEDVFAPWLYVKNSWVLLEPVHALRQRRARSLLAPLLRKSSLSECHVNLKQRRPSLCIRMLLRRVSCWLKDEIAFLLAR